jgi:D-glutamate cyclase
MPPRGARAKARRDQPLLNLIAENVDRLVNLDISGYGVIRAIYEAARAHHKRPLTLLAAERLRERIRPGDRVFLTSGWVMPGFYPVGETDGPIGVAALGRSLGLGLGAKPVILTEEPMIPITAASCRGAGLNVLTEADLERAPRPPHPNNLCALILPLPIDDGQAVKESRRLFDQYRPKALIAVEKNGPNRKGVYHMVGGFDNSDCVAKAGRLFEDAVRRKVLTIGIGDRGNEIGFGAIQDVPRRLLPFGRMCTCPCKGGVVDATVVDVLVTAAVSNWGAYGIGACLAAMLGRPEVLHDPATEARMLRCCIDAGGVDGFSCRPVPCTDGMVEAVHLGLVALLNEIVRAPAAKGPAVFSTPLYRERK